MKKLAIPKSERHQNGSVSEVHGAFHIRYYVTEIIDGVQTRKLRSKKLCAKNRDTGHGSATAKAVQALAAEFMLKVNAAVVPSRSDMPVIEFWEKLYLPYCETQWKGKGMKPATIKGYKQVWQQHLKGHFQKHTLQKYTSEDARLLLQTLKTTQGKNTLKHIRALGSAMFSEAIERNLVNVVNPWHVRIPKDAIEPEETPHYTLEQAEDMISALVEHVDAQLVLSLACFVGLRRGEIAGLKWEDCDGAWIHIRRSLSDGEVGTPKSKAALAPVPLLDQVRVPLELWRAKCGGKTQGWMFHEDGPLDINNMVNRVIIPHVNGVNQCVPCKKTPTPSGVTWQGLHAGRRGTGTMVIAATGNIAVAQAMLRHEKASTTANMYKKELAQQAYSDGVAIYQKSLTNGGK